VNGGRASIHPDEGLDFHTLDQLMGQRLGVLDVECPACRAKNLPPRGWRTSLRMFRREDRTIAYLCASCGRGGTACDDRADSIQHLEAERAKRPLPDLKPKPTKHLNQVELARRWSMSPRTLERWRWQRTGPAYLRLRGRVVYRLQDIEAFEELARHSSNS
jgi:hypothetical protein